jgi:hypothetical protein
MENKLRFFPLFLVVSPIYTLSHPFLRTHALSHSFSPQKHTRSLALGPHTFDYISLMLLWLLLL